MPTINQLVKQGRKSAEIKTKTPALKANPKKEVFVLQLEHLHQRNQTRL